jgi:hypothetical protein
MPRITIDFEERPGAAGEGAQPPGGDMEAIDGGAAPAAAMEGPGVSAGGDVTDAGAPPEWLLEAIAQASAAAPAVASGTLGGEDGGAAPTEGDGAIA